MEFRIEINGRWWKSRKNITMYINAQGALNFKMVSNSSNFGLTQLLTFPPVFLNSLAYPCDTRYEVGTKHEAIAPDEEQEEKDREIFADNLMLRFRSVQFSGHLWRFLTVVIHVGLQRGGEIYARVVLEKPNWEFQLKYQGKNLFFAHRMFKWCQKSELPHGRKSDTHTH